MTAWQARVSGLMSTSTVPQYPSKVSGACLVMTIRFSQDSSSPDKSLTTGRSEVKCQALSLETVEMRPFCRLVLNKK